MNVLSKLRFSSVESVACGGLMEDVMERCRLDGRWYLWGDNGRQVMLRMVDCLFNRVNSIGWWAYEEMNELHVEMFG